MNCSTMFRSVATFFGYEAPVVPVPPVWTPPLAQLELQMQEDQGVALHGAPLWQALSPEEKGGYLCHRAARVARLAQLEAELAVAMGYALPLPPADRDAVRFALVSLCGSGRSLAQALAVARREAVERGE